MSALIRVTENGDKKFAHHKGCADRGICLYQGRQQD
jgi:hypothetical protein